MRLMIEVDLDDNLVDERVLIISQGVRKILYKLKVKQGHVKMYMMDSENIPA